MKEKEIIRGVVEFLNENGYVAWRQENGGRFNQKYAVKKLVEFFHYSEEEIDEENINNVLRRCWRKIPKSVKGVADVIGYDKSSGRWIAVEVKAPGDYLRKEQATWLRDLRNAGGETFIAKSVEEFKAKYRKLKIQSC